MKQKSRDFTEKPHHRPCECISAISDLFLLYPYVAPVAGAAEYTDCIFAEG